MRKYFQITTVISVLFFLVWLRSATFKVDDAATTGVKKKNITGFVSIQPTPTATITPTPISNQATSTNSNTNENSSVNVLPTDIPVPQTNTQTGQYKDGAYTGSVVDAFYGNIQVQAVISGGQITDVIFLQYPDHNNTSININSQAMPLLKQEAIAAQSAQVSGVSGASATSPAFKSSLASALSQAVN